MKRTMCFILCLSLTLLVSHDTHARKKRKKGEPVICKKGKLIFEDDFSEQELLWAPQNGEWQIIKKTLATKSAKPKTGMIWVLREFSPTPNVVFQLRAFAPRTSNFWVTRVRPSQSSAQAPGAQISPVRCSFAISHIDGGQVNVALNPLPYQKPRWITVLFEILDRKYALTVDGKTITYEAPNPEPSPESKLMIVLSKPDEDIFAIDDVKVWEALPLDEDEKDKKKKRR